MDESELHALIDGELSAQRRREVEDYLLAHKEDAALVENWRRQNAALRAAFEPVALETPPLSLRNAAARNAAALTPPIESGAIHWGRPSSSFRPGRRFDETKGGRARRALIAAAALLLVTTIAGVAVFLAPKIGTGRGGGARALSQGYVERADIAYATFAGDVRPAEFDPTHKTELLAALLARIGFAYAPDLSSVGLRFMGGRLVPGLLRPAALLFYETAAAERVALYFERAEADPAALTAPKPEQGLTAVEWRGAGVAFVLIGPLSADKMQTSAERAAYEIVAPARGEGQ
ncbi:MAG TPA: anti-sigma factor [Methylocystis sp.]|nr:anti-sigma factor [Methylocystis sp.]